MSTEDTPRFAGVADEVLVTPDGERRVAFALCKGCQRDGHTGNHTHGPRKLLSPGHTWNGAGRPHGRPNDKTIAAAVELKAAAHEVAQGMLATIRNKDTNEYIRAQLQVKVLELTGVKALMASEPPDVEYLDYITDEELATLCRIVDLGKARMEAGVEPYQPPVWGDGAEYRARYGATDVKPDAFAAHALPAPRDAEPEQPAAEPEDDDWIELGGDDSDSK